MIFGFLVNMDNTIAIYSYSTPWVLIPQKWCVAPEFFVLISSHCSTQIWRKGYGGSWSIYFLGVPVYSSLCIEKGYFSDKGGFLSRGVAPPEPVKTMDFRVFSGPQWALSPPLDKFPSTSLFPTYIANDNYVNL